TDAGRIFSGLQRLIALRKHLPALEGGHLTSFWTHNPSVLGYLRGDRRQGDPSRLLVLGNFSEVEQIVNGATLAAMPESMIDLIGNSAYSPHRGIRLAPYQMVWLTYPV
ncbi:MAG: DUF3459 domain-containing protein, partial [Propionivibrio sp.]|nr:DUF3459 domain-containing protein [Propionivibrio sp.]